jgi:hypothetical protein
MDLEKNEATGITRTRTVESAWRTINKRYRRGNMSDADTLAVAVVEIIRMIDNAEKREQVIVDLIEYFGDVC